MDFEYCKLEIFVPKTHLDAVREALRKADAGHVGNYDCCLSYSETTGCWRPLPGSSPYLGEVGALCCEAEYKVETVCLAEKVEETLRLVRAAHPYEVPVINVLPLYGTGCGTGVLQSAT